MKLPSFINQIIAAVLILATGIPPILADSALPDIGQSGASIMTPAEERRTGETVVRNIRRAGGIIEDSLLNDYVNNLGYRLLAHTENPDHYQFQFFIVNDSSINAFALPGGFIGINYGLILASDSESELASVLAHEISHITQRHHVRSFENASGTQIPVLAAIIAAMILGSKGNDLGEAAMASAAAGTVQQQINFTRHNEEEADRIGIQMVAKAELDPSAMATFFNKLDKQSRLQGDNVPSFLRTHPVNVQRITDAQSRAAQLPKVRLADSLTYDLMKQRVIALASEDPNETIRQYTPTTFATKNNIQNTAAHYGHAMLLMRQEKYTQADAELTDLMKTDPHRIAYLLAHAESLLKNKQIQLALRQYEAALKLYPNNAAITHAYVSALLQNQQAAKAKTILTAFIKNPPQNPEFYQFLARSEAMLNNPAASHEAMAEYYYAIGQLHQALDQIALALKLPKLDFYTLSRLEARSAQIKQEILPNTESGAGNHKYKNLLID